MTAALTATSAITLAAIAGWLVVDPWRDDRMARLMGAEPSQRRAPLIAHVRALLVVGAARRRQRRAERVRVLQALVALAAELDAGQPPSRALVMSGGDPSVWPAAVGAANSGADIAGALRIDGRRSEVLRHLSACWQVAIDAGAGLSRAVSALAASARAAEEVRVQLEAELAGPRATARTLALLPLAGMAFGTMLGGDPLGWLVGTAPGLACLIGGVVLTSLGMLWTARIAKAVENRL